MATEQELTDEAFKVFALYVEGLALDEAVIEELYEALNKALNGATREEIVDIALTEGAKLIDNILIGTQDGIAEMVADALEQQKGVPKLGRELREKIGLNGPQMKQALKLEADLRAQGLSEGEIKRQLDKFTEEKIKERAKVIANTEMRAAISQGEKKVMQARGARYKVAITSQDAKVSDICEANEQQGPIPIDEEFASGHDTPPFHPDCRCSVHFVTSDAQVERERKRAETRAQRVETAKAS